MARAQLRHGIFKSEATVKDIDEIVAARFVDKRGKLREELERNWQELTVNVDALIVNADFKVRLAVRSVLLRLTRFGSVSFRRCGGHTS